MAAQRQLKVVSSPQQVLQHWGPLVQGQEQHGLSFCYFYDTQNTSIGSSSFPIFFSERRRAAGGPQR